MEYYFIILIIVMIFIGALYLYINANFHRRFRFQLRVRKHKNELVDILIRLVCVGLIIFSFNVIKFFVSATAIMIQNTYSKIFYGNFTLSDIMNCISPLVIIFVYIMVLIVLLILLFGNRNNRGGPLRDVGRVLSNTIQNKRLIFIGLAITASLSLIFIGTQFLYFAFPAERLFSTGFSTSDGSNLICKQPGFNNIVSGQYMNCKVTFSNTSILITKIELVNYINGTFSSEEDMNFNGDVFYVAFVKEKSPTFLRFYTINGVAEVFNLNYYGIYTSSEYIAREQEKVKWFYALITLSIFTVIATFSNLKNILEWE